MIFDPETPKGAHALERLGSSMAAWLTTVSPDGQPQSMPVWFVWDGEEILVYGDHRAKRNKNLASNPKVGFHLPDNGNGQDIVAIEGVARVDPQHAGVPDNPAYLAKYGERITSGWGSAEAFGAQYSVPLRFTPRRVRGY